MEKKLELLLKLSCIMAILSGFYFFYKIKNPSRIPAGKKSLKKEKLENSPSTNLPKNLYQLVSRGTYLN